MCRDIRELAIEKVHGATKLFLTGKQDYSKTFQDIQEIIYHASRCLKTESVIKQEKEEIENMEKEIEEKKKSLVISHICKNDFFKEFDRL